MGESPKIVIAGRPNVGKSTLFNRICGRKRSITAPIAGVTRDCISERCRFAGYDVELFDCGGIGESGSAFDGIVTEKARNAVKDADLILLVVDCRNRTPEDDEVVESFRKYSDRLVLVVNKVDEVIHDDLVWNFHSYGFQTVVGVSAEHGRGIEPLEAAVSGALGRRGFSAERCVDAVDDAGATDVTDDDDSEWTDEVYDRVAKHFMERGIASKVAKIIDLQLAEYADQKEVGPEALGKSDDGVVRISVMGRPNVGKSTLVNALTGSELSIVSPLPGTTRDTVKGSFEYKGRRFEIVDTAGMRRKSRVDDDIEYYSVNRAIRTIAEADIVLLVIDSVEGIADQDKKIASLAVNSGRGVIIVLNKTDLLAVKNQFAAIEDRVRFVFPILSFAPVCGVSAKTGDGFGKMLDTAVRVRSQLCRRVPTSKLNEAVRKWNTEFHPPRDGKMYYKVLYVVQVEVNPVRFLLFVNRKKGFPQGYVVYIKNRLRKDFGFANVPIDIVIRERRAGERREE